MTQALYFIDGLSVAIDHDHVIECRENTIVEFDDEQIVAVLLKRPSVRIATERERDVVRYSASQCLHPIAKARQIVAPLDVDAMLADYRKRAEVRAMEKEMRGSSIATTDGGV